MWANHRLAMRVGKAPGLARWAGPDHRLLEPPLARNRTSPLIWGQTSVSPGGWGQTSVSSVQVGANLGLVGPRWASADRGRLRAACTASTEGGWMWAAWGPAPARTSRRQPAPDGARRRSRLGPGGLAGREAARSAHPLSLAVHSWLVHRHGSTQDAARTAPGGPPLGTKPNFALDIGAKLGPVGVSRLGGVQGGCPSGQRERPVKSPAQPTQVRILLPPSKPSDRRVRTLPDTAGLFRRRPADSRGHRGTSRAGVFCDRPRR
jgi:hypothetical protein